MTRKIYCSQKIPVRNPHVLRVIYQDKKESVSGIMMKHRRLRNKLHKLIDSTWGCSELCYENVLVSPDEDATKRYYASDINGAIRHPNWENLLVSYMFFENEDDALQAGLMFNRVSKCVVWPNSNFTVYEYHK